MNAAPLPEYEDWCRMATRLQVVWPWLLVLTLGGALGLHHVGVSGWPLIGVPAVGGLVLTLAVVLQARRPRQRTVPPLTAGEPPLSVIPSRSA